MSFRTYALSTLSTLMISLGCIAGSSITKYVNLQTLQRYGTEIPRLIGNNREIILKIYDDYDWLVPTIITYIRGAAPTIDGFSERLAALLNAVLEDANGKKLLQFFYGFKPDASTKLIGITGGDTVRSALENYAPRFGIPKQDARSFSRAFSALLQWFQVLYKNIYEVHIKNKLNDIFAAKDRDIRKAIIKEKIKNLLLDPGLCEVLYDLVEKFDDNKAFVRHKLATPPYSMSPALLNALESLFIHIQNAADELGNFIHTREMLDQ